MNSNAIGKGLNAMWQPPAELAGCRPREVRLTGAGRTLVVLAVLLAAGSIAAGVLLYAKAAADRAFRRELAEVGNDLDARVTRCWTSGKKGDTRYWVEYEFRADGRTITDRVRVGKQSWSALKPGSVLPVRYLPANSTRHVIRGLEEGPLPLWVPFALSGALALAAWLVTLPLKSQRRLLAEGRPAQAVVVLHKKTKDAIEVRYQFRQLSGAVAKGKGQQGKSPTPVGSSLCVIYDPDRVRHNAIYPLSLVRTRRGAELSKDQPRGGARRSGERADLPPGGAVAG